MWQVLGLPEPTPVQYEIADYLQNGPKRGIICGFRGVGKSWITSAFVLWCLMNDPMEKILVVSASKGRADDFTTFTLKLIREVWFFKHLAPKRDPLWRESKVAFDVGPCSPAHAPSMKSAGITGQITGSRATRIIADDVEVPSNSATEDLRDKLMKAVAEFDAILVPEGEPQIMFLGTPQTEESIYNKLRERGYTMRVWPSLYPTDPGVYTGALAPSYLARLERDPSLTGEPADPQRFSFEDLMERKASYGSAGFALQFMLDTSLSDAEKYPLKTADLVVMSLNEEKAPVTVQWASSPELQIRELPNLGFSGDRWYRPMYADSQWAPYEGVAMAIDPSGRGTDELAYAVVASLHGYLFLLDVGGLQGGYDEAALTALAKVAQRYRVNQIVIESNFGDGMFTALFQPVLQRYHKAAVEEVRHNTQKEHRIIDTLEPILNQHRLIVNEAAVRQDVEIAKDNPAYSLFTQLTRITYERGALRHDDRLDALAMVVNYWVDAMARDSNQAVHKWREKALNEELRLFMQNATGKPSRPKFGRSRGMARGSRRGGWI